MENETVTLFFIKDAAGEYADGCTTEYEWAKEQAEDWEGATVWEVPVSVDVQKAKSSDALYSTTKEMTASEVILDGEIVIMFFLKNAAGEYVDGCTTEYEWAKEQAEDWEGWTVWEVPVVVDVEKATKS